MGESPALWQNCVTFFASLWVKIKDVVDRIIVFGNVEPILTIRRVLWLFTGGIWLGLLYVSASMIMLSTIVFAPFALQVLRIALFALDGGITLEPYFENYSLEIRTNFWSNPAHPYTIAANIAWAVLIGWALVLFHLFFAVIQALTVIGIGTALTNVEIAAFVIWPFGRSVQRKELPTTLADLHLSRMSPSPSRNRSNAWA